MQGWDIIVDMSALLHSSGTFCLTWAGRLRPRHFALWWQSFCFRYSVRALGNWQYGWYVVTRAWEISQAYEVFRGSVGSVQRKLNWHKNSDLGSEVGTSTDLNTAMLHLIESVVLLTKSIGIVTPQILSVVVVVAPRLISYKSKPPDCIARNKPQDLIVHEQAIRSYRTWASMRGRKRKETRQSNVAA